MLQNESLEGCTQGSRVTRVRPTTSCCKHTHVCCQIHQIRAAPKGRNVTRVRPTGSCCKYTHVCCRVLKLRVSPKDQRLQRFHRLLLAHTCVLQNKSMQSCTAGQGLQRFRRRSAAGATELRNFSPTHFEPSVARGLTVLLYEGKQAVGVL